MGDKANVLTLYHSGFLEIRNPDLHHGRKNADFGQGFYLSDDRAFALRWARERKGEQTVLNTYELDLSGLKIHCFERGREWFRYLYGNRRYQPDRLFADVIIGPIANDTIFDTLGILTSGILKEETCEELLMIGPSYRQIAVKSERAAGQLKWLSKEVLSPEMLQKYQKIAREEEKAYQEAFALKLRELMKES